jgi:VWFA-related protein
LNPWPLGPFVCLALVFLVTTGVLAQQPPPGTAADAPAPEQQEPSRGEAADEEPAFRRSQATFEATSTVVLLDIVVRDRRGRPVRDLRPDEVQVFEDGERRELTTFTLVEGQLAEERVAGPISAGMAPDPSRQVSLVTLVFDKLLTEGRQMSKQAALDFIANNLQSNVWVSVFTIDQRLTLRQAFTQDPYVIRTAILSATGETPATAASLAAAVAQQEQVARQSLNIAEGAQAAAVATATTASAVNPSTIGTANAEAQMAQVVSNILRFSASLQRQQEGQSSLYPLLALVKAQQRLAGRKTLVYFAEGLQVPKNLEEVFKTAISEANRANVTVYAVDARGLNSGRDSDAARQQLLDAARVSATQMARRGAGAVTVDEVMIAENAEESLRANVQSTMAELAQSTGGFLTSDTNDFKVPMQRIATDIGSYYEAAYVPAVQEFDGKFRKIGVKVTRPGVTVQSRSGYFALPPGEGSALLPFELPLLTALTVDPPPHAFEYQAQALRFAPASEGWQHMLLFEVPLQDMTFEVDRRRKEYRLRFSLLAMVKDTEGRVVERFSDNYPFEGPLDKLEQLKRGNLVFRRLFTLDPGQYTFETVAQDRDSGKTSVVRSTLRVPGPAALALSSISLIRRLEEAPADLEADDPFRLDRMRIVPNLDVPISLAANPKLSIYLVAYAKPGTEAPKMMIEFLQGDTVVARARPELEPPDAQGRIPYVGTFDTDTFEPGRYTVRAVVMQGAVVAESEAPFTIVP